jgi:hypothetical protein
MSPDTRGTPLLKFAATCLLLIAAGLSSAIAQEQTKPPILADKAEVDRAEILRRGANVSVAGEGMRDSADLLFTMAMSPPATDSDQWHITLFGPSNDPATLALHQAFQKDEALTRFTAGPPDGRRAWAHYNWYRSDDRTQKFRFDEFQISGGYPVVVLQPPRDGSFGGIVPAKTVEGKDTTRQVVVDRIDGVRDPKSVGTRISASVKLWTQKLAKSGFVPPPKTVARYTGSDHVAHVGPQDAGVEEIGPAQQPPFPAPPPTVPFNPFFPPGGPSADPQPATLEQLQAACPGAPDSFIVAQLKAKATTDQAQAAWKLLQPVTPPVTPPATPPVVTPPAMPWVSQILTLMLGLLGGGTLTGVIVFAATAFRNMRKAAGQALLIPNDASFDELMALLRSLGHNPVPAPRATAAALNAPRSGA